MGAWEGRGAVRTVLGPYQLQAVIGRGRIGDTFRALDTTHDRLVAIKVLTTDPSDREYRARVDRASRVSARLRTPHVVGVVDHGLLDGRLFVAARLVEGPDLATVLARGGPLAPERAVSVIEQAGSALQAAHALGLAHRDLKPSNVLFESDEQVAVTDFGLVPPGGLSLDYTAPERIRGRPGDHREDVYSLGCVLFTCLTGAKPFPGRTLPERMHGHLEGPIPRPSAARSGVPRAFDGLVAGALAKAPADRWRTVGSMLGAAREALHGSM